MRLLILRQIIFCIGIQADILELESHAVAGVNLEEYSRSDNKRLLDPEDNSLSFHVCHSPQREVEILHDRLLAMLEADPTLTAARHYRYGG
ncbi:exonuclease V subunit [Salmonella enterica subsp. enterica serovar Daytona]|uniref:Exonuclease V subunit n=1 Tax=Salmonella enterica subsp. enterica serovar Daytona TaxID=1962639 RepID=A0A447JD22_SALET|nr:exonuclease V subunit [Salmonella enterica subsp. enterica serovar Daytona]